jgi:cell division ATPase FtsA
MAKVAPEGLITALDIGSSKVSAMIAQKGDGGELIVLGTGQRESRGVKRGYIADMATTEAAVREAVEQAERIAGITVSSSRISMRCSPPGATRSIRRGGWCCTRSRRSTRSTG